MVMIHARPCLATKLWSETHRFSSESLGKITGSAPESIGKSPVSRPIKPSGFTKQAPKVRIPVRFRWSDPPLGRIAWVKAPRSANTGDFPAFAGRVRSVIFQRRPQQRLEIGRFRGPGNLPALRPVILRCGVVLSPTGEFPRRFSDFRHLTI
jgi:hypothetical protein